MLRDRSLLMGGVLNGRGGGQVEFYPYKKSLAMLKAGGGGGGGHAHILG